MGRPLIVPASMMVHRHNAYGRTKTDRLQKRIEKLRGSVEERAYSTVFGAWD